MLGQLLGLGLFLIVSAAIASTWYAATIAREALRPPRGGVAFALAAGLPTHPRDLGLECEEWFVERDGARMPVWEIPLGAERDGRDLHVVILHGWGRSRVESLGRIGPFLEVAGRVYLPDLRGHGDATGRTRLGSGEALDIARLVELLPPGPVLLVGHSLGATIALRVASERNADRPLGVLALAPYDTVRSPIAGRLRARELPRGVFLEGAMLLLRAAGVSAVSTREAASRLRCPLVVLHGARDPISPISEGTAIAEAGRGVLERFERAAHADIASSEPERYHGVCERFARTLAGAAREDAADRTTGGVGFLSDGAATQSLRVEDDGPRR